MNDSAGTIFGKQSEPSIKKMPKTTDIKANRIAAKPSGMMPLQAIIGPSNEIANPTRRTLDLIGFGLMRSI